MFFFSACKFIPVAKFQTFWQLVIYFLNIGGCVRKAVTKRGIKRVCSMAVVRNFTTVLYILNQLISLNL